jgi:ribosomal protein S18 acetylase RimI-like enzyme
MAADREQRASSLADRIGFRPEQQDDEAFLYALYASTRAGEMALTDWDDAQKDAFLRMQFGFQTTHYRRHYGDASFQIILLDGRPIGRLYVHYRPRDVRLMDIALVPEHRGTGIGQWIVGNLLEEAARLHTPVTLHVEPYNRALRLYERLGFRTVEQRDMNLFMEWRPPSMANR